MTTTLTIKIIKESIKVLLFASIISTMGGISLEGIQESILAIIPLLILLPALNGMVGGFGTTFSAKLTTSLYLGEVNTKNILKSKEIRNLISKIYIIALVSAIYMTILAFIISKSKDFNFNFLLIIKILAISVIVTLIVISVIIFLSLILGVYYFNKKEDPNNFLIPITTAIGDLGSMFVLSVLVRILF